MASRWVATAAGTVPSSAFLRSTSSKGDARSISAVRGFRRSVRRGSMNVMSSANLRGVVRDPQQHEGVIVLLRIVVMVVAAFATLVVDAGARHGAGAQIGPRGRQQGSAADPGYWVGLSIGYVDGTTINDGDTGSSWRFGYTAQIRATLEKTLQRGVTVGASAGFSNAPLTYVSGFLDP